MSKLAVLTDTDLRFHQTSSALAFTLSSPASGHAKLAGASDGTVVLTGIAQGQTSDSAANKGYVDAIVGGGLKHKGTVAYATVTSEDNGVPLSAVYNASDLTLTGTTTWSAVTNSMLDIEQSSVGTSTSAFFSSNPSFVANANEFYHPTEGTSTTDERYWPTRILVNTQSNAAENGLYYLMTTGSGGSNYKLKRLSSFDDAIGTGEISSGVFVFIRGGKRYKNSGFVLTGGATRTLKIKNSSQAGDPMRFVLFSGMGTIEPGQNLSKTGSVLNVDSSPSFSSATIGNLLIRNGASGPIVEHASQTSGHTISLEQTSVSTGATVTASTMNSSTATMSNLTFTSASGTALSAQTGTFSTSLAVSNAGASKLTVDATGVNASNLKIGGGNAVVSQAGAITASSLMAAGLVADSSGTSTGPLQSASVTVPNVATLSTAGVASQVHVTAPTCAITGAFSSGALTASSVYSASGSFDTLSVSNGSMSYGAKKLTVTNVLEVKNGANVLMTAADSGVVIERDVTMRSNGVQQASTSTSGLQARALSVDGALDANTSSVDAKTKFRVLSGASEMLVYDSSAQALDVQGTVKTTLSSNSATVAPTQIKLTNSGTDTFTVSHTGASFVRNGAVDFKDSAGTTKASIDCASGAVTSASVACASATAGALSASTGSVTSTAKISVTASGVEKASVDTAGTFRGTAFLQTSDARLKTSVEQLDGADCLKKINEIDPVKFRFKDGDDIQLGFIAQQVRSVERNAVRVCDDDTYALDQTAILSMLLAAVKELAKPRRGCFSGFKR